MDDEAVDIVDKNGKVIKVAQKTEAHKHGWLHKTVIGYVRYGDHWLLVKQAPHKQDAGQYVAPVGGHVRAGETDIQALLRESDEEIGTSAITHTYIGTKIFHRQVLGRDENHLFIVYEIRTEEQLILNEESVSLKRFKPATLKKALDEKPAHFGEALYFVFESFYPEYLPSHYKRRYSL